MSIKSNLLLEIKEKTNLLNTLTNGFFAKGGFKAVTSLENDIENVDDEELYKIIKYLQNRIRQESKKKELFNQLKVNMMKINDLSSISNTDEKFVKIITRMEFLLPKITDDLLTNSVKLTAEIIECFEKNDLSNIEANLIKIKKVFEFTQKLNLLNNEKNNEKIDDYYKQNNDDLKWN